MSSRPADGTPPAVTDWGRTTYADALARQHDCVSRRIAGGNADMLVFTEHEPVFTVGMHTGAENHLVWSAEELAREGVTVFKTNRGGDITYHGPGQIVGYPIVSLEPRRDLHAYLRFLEQVLIDSLRQHGLDGSRRDGLTGIWIGTRKIAAIGVAVRRWVAYHGFALNVNANLAHFGGIVPCGIAASDGSVTSMHVELGRPAEIAAVQRTLADVFWAGWPAFLAGR